MFWDVYKMVGGNKTYKFKLTIFYSLTRCLCCLKHFLFFLKYPMIGLMLAYILVIGYKPSIVVDYVLSNFEVKKKIFEKKNTF